MLSFSEMQLKLKSELNEHRYTHSLGVMNTAVELAKLHNADIEKCRTAGLLHDCAKNLNREEMLELINEYSIPIYNGEDEFCELLHAPAGRALAIRDYGVTDEEVLSAIRNHTIAAKQMTQIDAIIYVADFIEPNRKSFEGLDDVRALSWSDLYGAMDMCKRLTDDYCIKNGRKVFRI